MEREMGVWMDLFVAPTMEAPLSVGNFTGLVADLIHERLVNMPATLFAEEVEANYPLAMANRTYQARSNPDLALYHGEDRGALMRALWAAPYVEKDLCLCFAGLAWENDELRANLSEHGFANAYVVLYAL